MAEARNLAALTVVDGEPQDFWRDLKRRIGRMKNSFFAGTFPVNIHTLGIVAGANAITYHQFDRDIAGTQLTHFMEGIIYKMFGNSRPISKTLAAILSGSLFWFALVQLFRSSLKWLLSYQGWMYESVHDGNVTRKTKLWFTCLQLIAKCKPMTNSFQGALPQLPLPALGDTLQRHLRSMRPILNDEEYAELVDLTEKFQRGTGLRLQRYVWLKSMLSTNYVTDWWERYVYLKYNTPIMINSNYYGMDSLSPPPTENQAARAANVTWAALQFRRMIERQEISPFAINPRAKVPFCSFQYTRLFNCCRIPGVDADTIRVWDDAKHVAVYSRGRWFKLAVHSGRRLLEPWELQRAFQAILDSAEEPDEGEQLLAALTAGNRDDWARVRQEHLGKGVNQASRRAIERSAFVVVLDEEAVGYDPEDPSKLDHWAETLLHGKGHDRWHDKSFNMIISRNGRIGVNAEHSWGDAAVTAHFLEFVVLSDVCSQGYTATGDCHPLPAELSPISVRPQRLHWKLDSQVRARIHQALQVAQTLIENVEMSLLVWTDYGKGFIKRLGLSPDAFIQMALQLTYHRNQGHFSLTYEASMTRLFREGRTETVRSCTSESCDFVRAMQNTEETREERLRLLHIAAERHQQLYRDAMCGKGVDRHLFALFVISRYLELQSPFFDRIFPPQYLLSTSQTPLNQCEAEFPQLPMAKKVHLLSAGGGFGPVTDAGYGVSYIIGGEDQISFHISSKRSAENSSSKQFREDLETSLHEMRHLFADDDEEKPKKFT